MKNYWLCFLTLILLSCIALYSCTYEDAPKSCPPVVRGKVVSKHPACAGIVVQVVSGSDGLLTNQWSDIPLYNQGNIYDNVFAIANPCELSTEDYAWLSDVENFSKEFSFYVLDNTNGIACDQCQPLVSLPSHWKEIYILPAGANCNDVLPE